MPLRALSGLLFLLKNLTCLSKNPALRDASFIAKLFSPRGPFIRPHGALLCRAHRSRLFINGLCGTRLFSDPLFHYAFLDRRGFFYCRLFGRNGLLALNRLFFE